MPTFNELIDQIANYPTALALVAFFVAGAVLLLIKDWRASILALLLDYLAMGFVLVNQIRPEIAFAKVLVGLFICLMLYLAARQAGWRQRISGGLAKRALLGSRLVGGEVFPPGRTFRLMVVLLAAFVTLALAANYPIEPLTNIISIAVYWLALNGLFLLILTENPLKLGQGLLVIIIGFELWYTTLEQSLLIIELWGVVNLLIALAIGYLTVIKGATLEEEF